MLIWIFMAIGLVVIFGVVFAGRRRYQSHPSNRSRETNRRHSRHE